LLVSPQAITLRVRSNHEGEQISEASEAITAKGDKKGVIATVISVVWAAQLLPLLYAEHSRVLQSL
jgi:hypothetical protein